MGRRNPTSQGPVEFLGRAAVAHVQGSAQRRQRLVLVQGYERPALGRVAPRLISRGGIMMKLTLLVASALFTASAVSAGPIKRVISVGELGPQPRDILAGVKAIGQTYLKDPDSAQYEIGSVLPGYCKKGLFQGKGVAWQGWAVNVLINAKNSYGGYTGFEPHTVLFVGDIATQIIEGYDFGAFGPSKGFLGGGAGVCQFIKN